MSEDFRISVDEGKYTIIVDCSGGRPAMRFLRHGEPWPAEDRKRQGDTLVYLLAEELHEARSDQNLRERVVRMLDAIRQESEAPAARIGTARNGLRVAIRAIEHVLDEDEPHLPPRGA